jgi:hypothetical protein
MKEDVIKMTKIIIDKALYYLVDEKRDIITGYLRCRHCGKQAHVGVNVEHAPDCVVLSAERIYAKLKPKQKERRNIPVRERSKQYVLERVKQYSVEKMKMDACRRACEDNNRT